MGDILTRTLRNGKTAYYARYVEVDGKRTSKATKAKSYEDAEKWLLKAEARVAVGKPGDPRPRRDDAPKAPKLTVRQLVEKFDAECQPDVKRPEKYKRAMKSAFECHLLPYLADAIAEDLRRTDVARWREAMKGDKRTNRQIVRAMMTASRLWNWALELGHLSDTAINPIENVDKPGLNPSTDFYTDAEVARLLATAAEEKPDLHGPIAFAYYSGARRGEIAALRWGDVDFDSGKIRIRQSWESDSRKSGVAVTVGIHPHLRAILEPLAAPDRKPDDLVFPDPTTGGMRPEFDHVDRVWGLRDVAEKAKVRKFKMPWHAFRHSHGTALAAAGANLGEIQQALGQSSLEMAKRYTEIAAEAVAKQVAKLPALGPVATSIPSINSARSRRGLDTGGISEQNQQDNEVVRLTKK